MTNPHTLPFDIAFEIASSVESLADLESLICASRPCYNAFSTHRNSIISSVLLNELGPANYRELLAIAHIPAGVSTTGSHGEEGHLAPLSRAETARLQRAFLRYELYCRLFPYEEAKSEFIKSSISGESQFDLFIRRLEPWEVEELCSIHRFFFNLAADYMADLEYQFVESFLAAGTPGLTGKWSRKRTWDAANSDAPAQLPSFAPPPCSGNSRSIRGTGVANMGKGWYNCASEKRPEERMVPFYAPELHDLDFFDEFCQSSGMADFANQLASLGLEFFSSLIDASTQKERRDKLRSLGMRHFTIFGKREFLPQALTHSPGGQESSSRPDWREGGNTERNVCCDNEREDPTRPNIGYREFLRAVRQCTWPEGWNSRYRGIVSRRGFGNPQHCAYDFPWDFPDDPFREHGCVFWDRARLVQFRQDLELNPECTIGWSSDIEIRPYRSRSIGRWRKRKSVEDRLRGILIQESRWKELLDEFAWPH
ncbi:hypothetical protein V8F06_010594 [Rhypophila decipiens]